jgi:hypothetical protein
MKLDRYQAATLTFLFDRLPIGDDVDSLEFALSGKFGGMFRLAHSVIEAADRSARVVFTLPTYSQSVFLALTRTRLNETARILANLEDYERDSSMQLGLGEVVLTPEQIQRDADIPHAVILLRTATSFDCAEVPDKQTIDGKLTQFFLAVPLTTDEWELRRQFGHDALMDRFQEDEKELFF